jgi:amino-acid N-acetyltransferase
MVAVHYHLLLLYCLPFFQLVSSFSLKSSLGSNSKQRYRSALHLDKDDGTDNAGADTAPIKSSLLEEATSAPSYHEIDTMSDEQNSKYAQFIKIKKNNIDVHSDHAVSQREAVALDFNQFASIFRHSAPYIAMHTGSTMVIHIAGYIMKNKEYFDAVMDDITILKLLGVQLVLVVGVREQVDERITQTGEVPIYHNGMRSSDLKMMQFLKEESGAARCEIEKSLAKGYSGLARQGGINVVSGNFFYTAKPIGVRNGIDFKQTGEVRRIECNQFHQRLKSGDVVMITSVGYSSSGEVFNVPSENLAAKCGAALKASKVLFITKEGESLVDVRNDALVKSLRLSQAVALLAEMAIPTYSYLYEESEGRDWKPEEPTMDDASAGIASQTPAASSSSLNTNFVRLLAKCVYAVTGGVRRAHLIPPYRGALLKELYTRDGEGVLISGDTYEGIRPAVEQDLQAILEIIRPLEKEGILVHRSDEQMMRELPYCYVMTRDNATLAVGMLKKYDDVYAEVYMLAVHPGYQKSGRGETVLAYLERRALMMGVSQVFLLSTRTMQWFEERGFSMVAPTLLPASRPYDKSRNSKVYMKKLHSMRDVDTEELMWNL